MVINDLIIFFLGSAGIAMIVTKSSIFKPLRDLFDIGNEKKKAILKEEYDPTFRDKISQQLHKLLTCPLCFGFWSGALVYFIYNTTWGYAFCLFSAASIVSFAIYSIVSK